MDFQALKRNSTQCKFCVLHYLRLEKRALTFSSEYITFQQSPKTNLASPLIIKTIELSKSYIFPMKVQNSQRVTNVQNMQPFLNLRAAGCLNTAYLFVFTIFFRF
jgi:hypothetical protein